MPRGTHAEAHPASSHALRVHKKRARTGALHSGADRHYSRRTERGLPVSRETEKVFLTRCRAGFILHESASPFGWCNRRGEPSSRELAALVLCAGMHERDPNVPHVGRFGQVGDFSPVLVSSCFLWCLRILRAKTCTCS